MNSRLHKKALWLSYFTVGYNILEGIVSILAGSMAGSIALIGFGLDSFVESDLRISRAEVPNTLGIHKNNVLLISYKEP